MGFTSGPMTFARYFLPGSRFTSLTERAMDAINQNAFGRGSMMGPDKIEFGWISPRHLFDTPITEEKITLGRFVLLGMRMDRISIPGAVLKSYVRVEEEAAIEASGREFLSKSERAQCREKAKLRADKEAAAGGFRRMAAYPVLVDFKNRLLLFGNTGPTANEKLGVLFKSTFEASIERGTAARLAHRLLGDDGAARGLETIEPFHLVQRPADGEDEDGGFESQDVDFLGKEFLTWLWHRADSPQTKLSTAAGENVAVMIDRAMRLVCDFNRTGSTVVTCDSPGMASESRAALAIGKQPTRMGLILGGSAGEFRFSLDGASFSIAGMVLPDDSKEERDPIGRMEARFDKAVDAVHLLDGVYRAFLQKRAGSAWVRELTAMQAWARGKRATPTPQMAAV